MNKRTLAARVGITAPISPLWWKLRRLQQRYPSPGADGLEAWLVDLGNSRRARVVCRSLEPPPLKVPMSDLTNEELAVGLLLPGLADEPQILRLGAQLISKGMAETEALLFTARREGALRILANLATQALRVAPEHPIWRRIGDACRGLPPLQDDVLHWTRLAEPVMPRVGVHAGEWRLVA